MQIWIQTILLMQHTKIITNGRPVEEVLVSNIHRTSLRSRDYSYVIFHETNIPMWLDTFRVTFSEQCVAWWSSYIKRRAEILVPLLQIVIIRLRWMRSVKIHWKIPKREIPQIEQFRRMECFILFGDIVHFFIRVIKNIKT